MAEYDPNLISEPGDDPTKMPDQQAASGQSYGNQTSILSLLGAMQGGQGDMTAMLPQPVSQTGAYAGALSGGISAMRGQPDPVQQIQQNAYKEQMGIVQMIQRMQQQADVKSFHAMGFLEKAQGRQDALKKTKEVAMDKYTDNLIASSDPGANLLGWTARNKQMQALGLPPIPPETLTDLIRKDLPKETMAQAISLLDEVPFPTIMAMYKGVKPEHEQLFRQAKGSDPYRKALGLESKAEEDWKLEERQIKRVAADMALRAEDRKNADEDRKERREDRADKQFILSERNAATAEKRADASAKRSDTMIGLAIASGQRADANAERAERRIEIQKEQFDRKFSSKDDKRNTSLNLMDSWLNEVDEMAARLDKKSFLPKTSKGVVGGLISGDPSAGKAAYNRFTDPNDADWTEFGKILQGGGVGFERTVHNDIGPRHQAAFKGIIGFFDNPSTLASIRQSTQYMRDAIKVSRGRSADDQVASQEIVYKVGGKTFVEKWSPGEPLPPGAEMLTVDGKPVWKGN